MSRAAISLAVLSLVLSGCSGGLHSDSPATQVYVLRPAVHPVADLTHTNASVHLSRPIAGPGLDTDHILLVQSGHRMSYFTGSRWPANLPAVVEGLVVETLRSSGAWSTVEDSDSAFASDYLLQIGIQRFEADYSQSPGTPQVHVVLDCTMGRRLGREVLGSFVATGSARAAANRLSEVVSAFEQASHEALEEIAVRSVQAVQSSQKVAAPVPSMSR